VRLAALLTGGLPQGRRTDYIRKRRTGGEQEFSPIRYRARKHALLALARSLFDLPPRDVARFRHHHRISHLLRFCVVKYGIGFSITDTQRQKAPNTSFGKSKLCRIRCR
jgi:hypothetical protein